MAIVTATTPLKINTTTTGEGYHNIFYEYVLSGLKSTLNNEFPGAEVYISPEIKKSHSPFSIRLWGESASTADSWSTSWQKEYSVSISLYSIEKNANENFYKQFYADAEHLYQLLSNKKTLTITVDSKAFTWIDGNVDEIQINEFGEDEDIIDGLHVASLNFTCLIEREG